MLPLIELGPVDMPSHHTKERGLQKLGQPDAALALELAAQAFHLAGGRGPREPRAAELQRRAYLAILSQNKWHSLTLARRA